MGSDNDSDDDFVNFRIPMYKKVNGVFEPTGENLLNLQEEGSAPNAIQSPRPSQCAGPLTAALTGAAVGWCAHTGLTLSTTGEVSLLNSIAGAAAGAVWGFGGALLPKRPRWRDCVEIGILSGIAGFVTGEMGMMGDFNSAGQLYPGLQGNGSLFLEDEVFIGATTTLFSFMGGVASAGVVDTIFRTPRIAGGVSSLVASAVGGGMMGALNGATPTTGILGGLASLAGAGVMRLSNACVGRFCPEDPALWVFQCAQDALVAGAMTGIVASTLPCE